jgi:hypothetical protein
MKGANPSLSAAAAPNYRDLGHATGTVFVAEQATSHKETYGK